MSGVNLNPLAQIFQDFADNRIDEDTLRNRAVKLNFGVREVTIKDVNNAAAQDKEVRHLGFFQRSAKKERNNDIRRTFYNFIVNQFGGDASKIPDSVRNVMKLEDYGGLTKDLSGGVVGDGGEAMENRFNGGHRLSHSRIRTVLAAMKEAKAAEAVGNILQDCISDAGTVTRARMRCALPEILDKLGGVFSPTAKEELGASFKESLENGGIDSVSNMSSVKRDDTEKAINSLIATLDAAARRLTSKKEKQAFQGAVDKFKADVQIRLAEWREHAETKKAELEENGKALFGNMKEILLNGETTAKEKEQKLENYLTKKCNDMFGNGWMAAEKLNEFARKASHCSDWVSFGDMMKDFHGFLKDEVKNYGKKVADDLSKCADYTKNFSINRDADNAVESMRELEKFASDGAIVKGVNEAWDSFCREGTSSDRGKISAIAFNKIANGNEANKIELLQDKLINAFKAVLKLPKGGDKLDAYTAIEREITDEVDKLLDKMIKISSDSTKDESAKKTALNAVGLESYNTLKEAFVRIVGQDVPNENEEMFKAYAENLDPIKG